MYYEINSLQHHGILGQKWGIRRYQNPDGTLTEAGRKRLSKDIKGVSKLGFQGRSEKNKFMRKYEKFIDKSTDDLVKMNLDYTNRKESIKKYSDDILQKYGDTPLDSKYYSTASEYLQSILSSTLSAKMADLADAEKIQSMDERASKIEMTPQEESKANKIASKFEYNTYGESTYRDGVKIKEDYANYEIISPKGYEVPSSKIAINFFKNLNNELSNIKENIAKEYYDKDSENLKKMGISRNKFLSGITIGSIFMNTKYNSVSIDFNDNNMFGGHYINTELDMDNMKIDNMSLWG